MSAETTWISTCSLCWTQQIPMKNRCGPCWQDRPVLSRQEVPLILCGPNRRLDKRNVKSSGNWMAAVEWRGDCFKLKKRLWNSLGGSWREASALGGLRLALLAVVYVSKRHKCCTFAVQLWGLSDKWGEGCLSFTASSFTWVATAACSKSCSTSFQPPRTAYVLCLALVDGER